MKKLSQAVLNGQALIDVLNERKLGIIKQAEKLPVGQGEYTVLARQHTVLDKQVIALHKRLKQLGVKNVRI